MPGLVDKDMRKLLKALHAQGCDIRRTGTGHQLVTLQGAYITSIPGTTGDRRSRRNIEADVRRAGLRTIC